MKKIWALAIIIVFSNCSSQKDEYRILEEAAKIHHEAVLIAHQVKEKLLLPDTVIPADTLIAVRNDLKLWEIDLVEVPGHENHDHGDHQNHDHSHHHVELIVTPDEMLMIQQELKRRIESIRSRVGAY